MSTVSLPTSTNTLRFVVQSHPHLDISLSPCSQWYPNVARVEHIQLVSSRVHNHEGEKYRLMTKLPLMGETTVVLSIHTDERPQRFVYSVDSWLLEINRIELYENVSPNNSTRIEWTVYTTRRSVLFQVRLIRVIKILRMLLSSSTSFYPLPNFTRIRLFAKPCSR